MFYEIALTFVKGLGNITIRNLISYCGSAEEVFKSSKKQLLKIPDIGNITADAIVNHTSFDRAQQELDFIEKYKINPLFINSNNYPKKLKNCYDAPVMLYYKGNVSLDNQKIISIVGTRNATTYGKQFCDVIVEALQPHNALIVSGLAYGIDIAAHKAAITCDLPTIGVLGHGLDRIYPAVHRSTAEKMLHNGGLLTEYTSSSIFDKSNFPKRNRIIAGLADVTIVVEAAKTGGALITAEIANSYNRDVFAVPGKIDDEFSAGCNFLIKTNRANLITGIDDLEYLMGWVLDKTVDKVDKQMSLPVNLTSDEAKIYQLIKSTESISIDDLQLNLNMQQSKLAINLLNLEMKSHIISLPGKIYKIN